MRTAGSSSRSGCARRVACRPGQSASLKWPVLHVGVDPVFDAATWHFKAGVCVTLWSTFDNRWEGVPVREDLSMTRPRPEATHVMAVGHNGDQRYGYSTNLPLSDLDRDDVLLAMRRNGEDISNEHGGPLRLVVPHLYAWKSCKWIRGLIFMEADKAGYYNTATTCGATRSEKSVPVRHPPERRAAGGNGRRKCLGREAPSEFPFLPPLSCSGC